MVSHYKELHIATCIEDLHRIALRYKQKTMRIRKAGTLLNLAKKLYSTSQSDPLDEEMTYILLSRFVVVYDQLLLVHTDRHFVTMMFDKDASKAKTQLEAVKSNLFYRYEEAATKKATPAEPQLIPSVVAEERTTVFNNASFVSCQELFRAISNPDNNLLVMDARTPEDFVESHIKDIKCINIPEGLIQSGLSAHRLGQLLPSNRLEQWNKRDTFHVIILMDWSTGRNNFAASKLDKLRSILIDWDIDKNYIEKPVVLLGGYMEWLEMFPMLCTRPNIRYAKTNTELDELLNLDEIEYPTESDSKVHEIFNVELAKEVAPELKAIQSREQILEEEKLVIEKSKQVALELLKQEQHWKDIHEKINNEFDILKVEILEQEEREAEAVISKLAQEETDLLEKNSKLAIDYNLSVGFQPGESHTDDNTANLKDITKLRNEHLNMLKAREALVQDRQRLLDEARQAKKPRAPPGVKTYKKPAIDRATKPKTPSSPTYVSHMEGKLQNVEYGLTGLVNIKNTCYMNTTIQCLRHIPQIIQFYCNGDFTKHIHRTPVISNELAHLVRALWSNSYLVIRPDEFYNKFTFVAPSYKAGYHEDCMEFYLQLFNYLSEDCAFEISSKNFWTESQMGWYKQHGGKVSFYINNFYHQIRIQQYCKECNITNLKFDVENVFYLTVPDKNFTLEDCMASYLHSGETFTCKKCKDRHFVKKTISCYPRILVIALKRHLQDYVDKNTTYFKKNENQCYFPTENFVVGKCTYSLRAVAMHVGSMQSGHYTAACLNPLDNEWYLFNDEEVTAINITDSSIRTKAYAFFYSLTEDHLNSSNVGGEKMYQKGGLQLVKED